MHNEAIYDTKIEEKIKTYQQTIDKLIIVNSAIIERIDGVRFGELLTSFLFAKIENILNYCKLSYLVIAFSHSLSPELNNFFINSINYLKEIETRLTHLVFINETENAAPPKKKKKYQYYISQIKLLLILTYSQKNPNLLSTETNIQYLCNLYVQFKNALTAYYPADSEKKIIAIQHEIETFLSKELATRLLQYAPQIGATAPTKRQLIETSTTVDYSYLTPEYKKKSQQFC